MAKVRDEVRKCHRCGKVKPPPRDRSTVICLECEQSTQCRHYLGYHEGCAKGVDIDAISAPLDGMAYRQPCRYMSSSSTDTWTPVPCEQKELYSIEELKQDDAEMDIRMANTIKTLAVAAEVKLEHAGKDWQGVKPCPVCDGKLHLSHSSYNGHVHGRCETEGCVSWME